MNESLPLATIHEAILDFARNRSDIVVFGAHAVNAYVEEPRMTQDVDILTQDAAGVSEELRTYLASRFNAAIRIRELSAGTAYRIYQVRKPKNRHLADVRGAHTLPPSKSIDGILVPTPAELIAQKIISMVARQGQPKAGSDWRDIATMLLLYPTLKQLPGEVRERLEANSASPSTIEEWRTIVQKTIVPDDETY